MLGKPLLRWQPFAIVEDADTHRGLHLKRDLFGPSEGIKASGAYLGNHLQGTNRDSVVRLGLSDSMPPLYAHEALQERVLSDTRTKTADEDTRSLDFILTP